MEGLDWGAAIFLAFAVGGLTLATWCRYHSGPSNFNNIPTTIDSPSSDYFYTVLEDDLAYDGDLPLELGESLVDSAIALDEVSSSPLPAVPGASPLPSDVVPTEGVIPSPSLLDSFLGWLNASPTSLLIVLGVAVAAGLGVAWWYHYYSGASAAQFQGVEANAVLDSFPTVCELPSAKLAIVGDTLVPSEIPSQTLGYTLEPLWGWLQSLPPSLVLSLGVVAAALGFIWAAPKVLGFGRWLYALWRGVVK